MSVSAPKTAGEIWHVSFIPGAVGAKGAITLPTELPDFDVRAGNPILSIAVTDLTGTTVWSYTPSDYNTGLAAGQFCIASARVLNLGDGTTAKSMLNIDYQPGVDPFF